MLAAGIPTKFDVPFANAASATYKRAVPTTSADPVAASLTNGFPAATFTPTGSGGTAPDGRDFNGILFQVTGWAQWMAAGGPVTYDATFQTTIGGYPLGAIIQSLSTPGKYYRSTTDANVTNPDSAGAGWTSWTWGSGLAAAVTSITAGLGLSGGTITSTGTIALLQASTSQLGGVKVDGSSIIISAGGVISSTTGGGGAVSSVGLGLPAIFTVSGSPVTTAGTLTATLATQNANLLWAGPTSGGAAAPTFRAIVSADMPAATSSLRGAVQTDGVTLFMNGSVVSLDPAGVNVAGARANLLAAKLGVNTDITALRGLVTGGGVPADIAYAGDVNTGWRSTLAGQWVFTIENAGAALNILKLGPNDFTFSKPVVLNYTAAPATSSSVGVTGTVAWDTGFLYVCTATNTWKRTALTTF